MSDLSDLYQEVILDHNRRPRNFGPLPEANRDAFGHNPLCGDQVRVFVQLEDDVVREIRFEGSGCAISKASASLMTDAVKGRRVADVMALVDDFQAMVTTPLDKDIDPEALGKLSVLAGVREFPVRIKCASLAWHTLKAAISKTPDAA
ncbi:MAG: Fe-S cluster assembly sulfur transfer protein SufU [Vicinamibacterales bacterium]